MVHDTSSCQDLRARLKSAQGHMRAIGRMIDEDAPWVETCHQLMAVRGSISAVQRELWRTFLRDERCALCSPNENERLVTWNVLKGILLTGGKKRERSTN